MFSRDMYPPINKLSIYTSLSGDGSIGIEEYRQDCVKRMAYSNIKDLDDAFNKLAVVNMLSVIC